MYRNTIIIVCAVFCVVAIGAGLLIAQLFRQSGVMAQPTPTSATSAPPTVVASQLTGAGGRPTAAAPVTSQPALARPAGLSAAPAVNTVVPAASSQPEPTPLLIAASAAQTPAYVEYIVQRGDILYTIAKNNSVTIEDILAINQIPNPSSLSVGQIIRIPKK